MDLMKATNAIEAGAARSMRHKSAIELDGLVAYLRQQIVEAEWTIARATQAKEAYQEAVDELERRKSLPHHEQ